MNESYLFDMTFNDEVFEGRNKAYGAYVLRLLYGRHIGLAAVLATSVFTAALAWPLLKPDKVEIITPDIPPSDDKGPVTILEATRIMPPPPPAPEPVIEQPQVQPVEKPQKTIAFKTPKVVPNDVPETGPEMPNVSQLQGAVIGTENQEGETSATGLPDAADETAGGSGAGEGTADANAVYEFAAEMPSFEGGEGAMLSYIGKRIKYPRQAVQEQVEGIVVVSFVVNRQGEITDASIIKGLGYGTDEEALRVVSSMPKWKPGKQNGKPVAVRYTLPIRFSMKR